MATKSYRFLFMNPAQIGARFLDSRSKHTLRLILEIAEELGYTLSEYQIGGFNLKGYTYDQVLKIVATVKTRTDKQVPEGYKSLRALLMVIFSNNNVTSKAKALDVAEELGITVTLVKFKTTYGLGFLTQGDYEKVFKKLQEHSSG